MGDHDSLVRYAFNDVEHARGILATSLPKEIVAQIELGSLALKPGHFVDENLEDRQSDVLYSARIAGRDGLIYILVEHKSDPEPLTPLQVLRYEVRIWDQHIASQPPRKRGEERKLPVILPIVLHHGRDGWTTAVCFEELLDADEGLLGLLGEYIPRLRLMVDDLWKQSDDELYGRGASAFGRLVLWCLKNAREVGWLEGDLGRWKDLMAVVLSERDGKRALTALLTYIVRTNPTLRRGRLKELLPADPSSTSREIEEAVMNWFEQEVHQGELRGELRGELKGERKVLLKQLRRRFGDLPAGVVARIEAAEAPDLEVWADRFVTASRLEEVLGAAASDRP